MNKAILGVLVVIVTILIVSCTSQKPDEQPRTLTIATSFFPIYEMTKSVAGDNAQVYSVIPLRVEPHEFDPTPSDIQKLSSADIFIYNGAQMEPWVDKIKEQLTKEGVILIDLSKNITLRKEENGVQDPHTWLSIKNLLVETDVIAQVLEKEDSKNAQSYKNNSEAFKGQLNQIDQDFQEIFRSCKTKDMLISHEFLGYFCADYGCNQISIEGFIPEAELSAKELTKIIETAKSKNISSVFIEAGEPNAVAFTIAEELRAKIIYLQNLEKQTPQANNIIVAMSENKRALREGLCT